MPHQRTRHLTTLLKKSLKFSSIVGVLGHRQVGKTTLAQTLGTAYHTLDLNSTLEQVERDPLGFLESNVGKPVVIDECQLAPTLFPALKEYVRRKSIPGQILLTGSVRFTSRKSIRESLTGRIINWELLPMDISELNSKPLPELLLNLLESTSFTANHTPSGKVVLSTMEKYLRTGGLPGLFAVRESSVRAQRFETQIETVLDRDLRLVSETTLSYRTIRALLVYLANQQGKPFEYSDVSRATRISAPTLRKLLNALESIFLIRFIPAEGGEKKPVIFFEDQGEASHLRTEVGSELREFERFLYANLRVQWIYRPEREVRLSQYRTRGGAYIPFVIRNKKDALGIIPIMEENPNAQAIGSAHSFLNQNKGGKIIYVHPGTKNFLLSSKQKVISASELLGL